MFTRSLAVLGLVAAAVIAPAAQSPAVTNESWTRPFPALRIVGNLYYVGTYDLSSYLITTPEGNILINTGVGSSVPMIRSNIEYQERVRRAEQAYRDQLAKERAGK